MRDSGWEEESFNISGRKKEWVEGKRKRRKKNIMVIIITDGDQHGTTLVPIQTHIHKHVLLL